MPSKPSPSGTLAFQSDRMERRTRSRPLCVAIDTGGTFTDCVWLERGRIRMLKVFSTPDDPSRAIADALEKIGCPDTLILLHGTTVGTNTLLQRHGGKVALVTTTGFEDVIEIGRQARPKLYDFFFDRTEPLVPGELRFGIEERTSSEGELLQEPTPTELRSLVERIRQQNPDAIAISLLFSFANPKNEDAVAAALEGLGVPLSVSHRILPEFREYERASTVVVNAYLQPVMQRYFERLEQRTRARINGPQRLKPATIGGLTGTTEVVPFHEDSKGKRDAGTRIFVMQSSGGITALDSAAREPVRTVLSGPAGGVVGAAAMARCSGHDRTISFDMGGTSTDVALIDREIRPSTQSEIAGLPVGVPMLDIHTVGAGGGSIARFDAAGALRVGPESAGADPGPICYGRGTQPTVTDANLILGRLQANHFLGGEFRLDEGRTRRIVSQWLKAQGSNLSLDQFASGVIRVVNATMEKAVRVVSIERGYDPREFALVAFGGAGGLHACELAEALSIPRVIVPALPGALSAFGILVSDVVKDYSRTGLWRALEKLPLTRLDQEFAVLRRQAQDDFHAEGWEGKVTNHASIDVRYRGPGYELNVPYTRGLVAAFRREHERRYGYGYPGREVELVTLRLRASVKSTVRTVKRPSSLRGRTQGYATQRNPVSFDGRKVSTAIWERELLPPSRKLSGPAVITEYSATTVVPPGKRFWIDRAGNLVIGVGGK
jgi:N-methylhydantoinase A